MSDNADLAPGLRPDDVQIDPRGYRFGAAVTAVVAILAILFYSAGWLLAAAITMALMVLKFLPGATVGPQATVQSWLFKTLIRPRLAPPTETESFRPPRFAQQMGFTMSIFGAVMAWLAVADVAALGWGVYLWGGFVLFASFLNSTFGFCLGCEIYLLLRRATAPRSA